MAKKPSGLGRGLGELLEDNAPAFRQGQGSAIRIETKPSPSANPSKPVTPISTPAPKPLYAEIHKNKSLKANFKNFK